MIYKFIPCVSIYGFASTMMKRRYEIKKEKKKTEELLYEMLPKIIAQKLRNGEKIEAQSYECVTVYFSGLLPNFWFKIRKQIQVISKKSVVKGVQL